jgi:hypothetical protein
MGEAAAVDVVGWEWPAQQRAVDGADAGSARDRERAGREDDGESDEEGANATDRDEAGGQQQEGGAGVDARRATAAAAEGRAKSRASLRYTVRV